MRVWERFCALFARERLDREFDEEARAHLDLAEHDYIQRGHSPAEARRLAHMKFGATEAAKDAHRDSRGLAWLEGWLYDLRHAVRGLWRDRMFALAAIVILALPVSLNETTFRILDATLLHGYPLVKQNARMLFVNELYPKPGCCVTYDDYEAWQTRSHSFQGLAFSLDRRLALSTGTGDARDLWVSALTSNAFHLLGVKPDLGRDFQPSDEKSEAQPVVIVSRRYWVTRLGGRADVIGRKLYLNKVPASIIGVMPEGFSFPLTSDIWVPLEQSAGLHGIAANGSYVFGRLREGVTESAARAELVAINASLEAASPATNRGVHVETRNFMDSYAGTRNARVLYGTLWAAAWLVLGIACANLMNLALARVQSRTREISTRMALGAGRGRVVRQCLLESLLVAILAGLFAWWISAWSIRLWAAATDTPNRAWDYSVSFGTVVYLIVVTLCVAGAITLAPLSRLWRLDLNGALKSAARGGTMSLGARRISAALVAGQMALAIVLLSGAGVLGRSLRNVLSADIGVRTPEKILVGRFELPLSKYATADSRVAFFNSLSARLRDTPGVVSAAISNGLPADDREPRPLELERQAGSFRGAPVVPSGPDYFRTVGAAILAGRDFNMTDRFPSTPVAIVNRQFAETYFPNENVIGQRIRLYVKRQTAPEQWRTIVGVASNLMQNDIFRQHQLPVVYVPFAQEPATLVWFFARVPDVSAGLAATVRAEAQRADPGLELLDFDTLKDSLGLRFGQSHTEYLELTEHATVARLCGHRSPAGIHWTLRGGLPLDRQPDQRDWRTHGARSKCATSPPPDPLGSDDSRHRRPGVRTGGIAGREPDSAISTGRRLAIRCPYADPRARNAAPRRFARIRAAGASRLGRRPGDGVAPRLNSSRLTPPDLRARAPRSGRCQTASAAPATLPSAHPGTLMRRKGMPPQRSVRL